jgi:hypothetical protein
MKRDMDLVRQILQAVENHDTVNRRPVVEIEGRSREEVSYHVMIMAQAGLLDAVDSSDMHNGLIWKVRSLTWAGHEFLDAVRSETVWNEVKKQAKSAPLEIIKQLAISIGKKLIGL